VHCPICAAKTAVRYPRSAKTTAQVNPETPAPTIATVFGMAESLKAGLPTANPKSEMRTFREGHASACLWTRESAFLGKQRQEI
jgi:hypothetical protein